MMFYNSDRSLSTLLHAYCFVGLLFDHEMSLIFARVCDVTLQEIVLQLVSVRTSAVIVYKCCLMCYHILKWRERSWYLDIWKKGKWTERNVGMDLIKMFYKGISRIKLGPESLLQLFSYLTLSFSYLYLIPSFFTSKQYMTSYLYTSDGTI
jgi:hypothetical protein